MNDSDRTGVALLARDSAPPWDLLSPRFPVVRRGYDRDAVDDYVAALEAEIEELRAGRDSSGAVAAEIERIGEQTAAILRVAHEQASETTRRAHAEADRCLGAAASNAVAMTQDAKNQLRQLDGETEAIWTERSRLLEDVKQVATSLFSLAEDALERFPSESERVTSASPRAGAVPEPVAAQPVGGEVMPEGQADEELTGHESLSDVDAVSVQETSEFHQHEPDDREEFK
jgi:DivIVA domain-containing protein